MPTTRQKKRPRKPVPVFVSYAHKDIIRCDEFKEHVSELQRQKIVDVWWDGRIEQDKPWNSDILAHLRSARIVVLLVTECVLDSWYINEKEVTLAMKQHRKGTTTVLPVIVRSCHWERSVFAKFNPFPKKQQYISIHRNKGWTEIAKKIDTLATGRAWK